MDLFVNAVIMGLGLGAAMILLPLISMAFVGLAGLVVIVFEKIKGN